ncbi:Fic family protein [Planococcus sp. CPCC 101016]|uniref:Fic family protein n=1 Tax=Planococcus sp. CPCC 101016 TaxID=2599617 RepID=UPI0021BD9AD3|nr:Fic family protein [Planococcus sp. CPCC 101016]
MPNEIEELFTFYDLKKNRLYPLELTALFYFKFIYIHPFIVGNRQTARLLISKYTAFDLL